MRKSIILSVLVLLVCLVDLVLGGDPNDDTVINKQLLLRLIVGGSYFVITLLLGMILSKYLTGKGVNRTMFLGIYVFSLCIITASLVFLSDDYHVKQGLGHSAFFSLMALAILHLKFRSLKKDQGELRENR